jgi:integral membrane protein
MTKTKAIRSFRIIAILEGISYLALFITMPLKYWAEMPTPNYVVGAAHGGLFIAYCAFLLICWIKFDWKFIEALKLFIASLVPFGTFYMDSKFLKNEEVALKEAKYGS